MDYSVLIVDDEIELAESTAEYLTLMGIPSKCVFTAKDALAFFKKDKAKLILLDINLGNSSDKDYMSGFEVCRILRNDYDIPILFISARSSDDDMVVALNIGGDDYITKPYSLSVLHAKVKAVLKRYESSVQAAGNVNKESENKAGENKVEFGDVVIDLTAGMVKRAEEYVSLTAIEYKLLAYLVCNHDKVISKQEIFDNVWDDSFVSDGTLNVHLRHLREKLEEDPNNPVYIKTIRGQGLLFKLM